MKAKTGDSSPRGSREGRTPKLSAPSPEQLQRIFHAFGAMDAKLRRARAELDKAGPPDPMAPVVFALSALHELFSRLDPEDTGGHLATLSVLAKLVDDARIPMAALLILVSDLQISADLLKNNDADGRIAALMSLLRFLLDAAPAFPSIREPFVRMLEDAQKARHGWKLSSRLSAIHVDAAAVLKFLTDNGDDKAEAEKDIINLLNRHKVRIGQRRMADDKQLTQAGSKQSLEELLKNIGKGRKPDFVLERFRTRLAFYQDLVDHGVVGGRPLQPHLLHKDLLAWLERSLTARPYSPHSGPRRSKPSRG
jgi:hypothetical protein